MGKGISAALVQLLRGWPCHLNLISSILWRESLTGQPVSKSSALLPSSFQHRTFAVSVRASMGRDVAAACGQLRGRRERHEHHGKA